MDQKVNCTTFIYQNNNPLTLNIDVFVTLFGPTCHISSKVQFSTHISVPPFEPPTLYQDIMVYMVLNHHLPQKKLENKAPCPPPWEKIRQPSIKTTLLDPTINKQTNPTILKTCALETIDSYPTTAVHVCTDGSAFRATKFAGYGVLVGYPDGSRETLSDACGNNSSHYEAEIIAITSAIELLHQQYELQEKRPM